jgi:cytochrome c oxidase subunit II
VKFFLWFLRRKYLLYFIRCGLVVPFKSGKGGDLMNSKVIGMVVVVLLIAAGAFLLFQNNSMTNNSATTQTQNETAVTPTASATDVNASPTMAEGDAGEGEVKEFTVTSSNFKFAPTAMTVKKGDTVRVTLKNTQGMHDFVIDEFDAKTKVIEGEGEETIEFVADEAGKFEYYCSVGQHRQMGMVGMLTVTE